MAIISSLSKQVPLILGPLVNQTFRRSARGKNVAFYLTHLLPKKKNAYLSITSPCGTASVSKVDPTTMFKELCQKELDYVRSNKISKSFKTDLFIPDYFDEDEKHFFSYCYKKLIENEEISSSLSTSEPEQESFDFHSKILREGSSSEKTYDDFNGNVMMDGFSKMSFCDYRTEHYSPLILQKNLLNYCHDELKKESYGLFLNMKGIKEEPKLVFQDGFLDIFKTDNEKDFEALLKLVRGKTRPSEIVKCFFNGQTQISQDDLDKVTNLILVTETRNYFERHLPHEPKRNLAAFQKSMSDLLDFETNIMKLHLNPDLEKYDSPQTSLKNPESGIPVAKNPEKDPTLEK